MTNDDERALRDRRLAYALARVGLGLNIALHGLVRLPTLSRFAAGMRESFAESPLPPDLVYATSLGIPVAEALIGVAVALGIALRPSLVAGTWLMMLLIVGACFSQNWSAAGIQMTYLGFYVALVATARFDAFSIDAWRATRRRA